MEFKDITEKIIGCAYKVYNTMATGTNVGLLINFGEDKVEIKRKVRVV